MDQGEQPVGQAPPPNASVPCYFWAKTVDGQPGISVRDHCINVGCVAERLIESLPEAVRSLLPRGAATLAALHDVGKICPGFLAKCPRWLVQLDLTQRASREAWANCESDHARVSQLTLQEALGNSRLNCWAAVIGAHHGRIKGRRISPANIWSTGGTEWSRARRELLDELKDRFGPLPDSPPADDAILCLLAGLITVSDWIGSDEKFFSPEGGQEQLAAGSARRAVLSAGWEPVTVKAGRAFHDLFPGCPAPRPLQVSAMDHITRRGLYLIESEMGSGKTEAALAAAHGLMQRGHARGFYFALPTQVTSNRIYRRVADYLDHAGIGHDTNHLRLAHATAWLRETIPAPSLHPTLDREAESEEHANTGRSWFASARRALLAPFGVGTIDQALLGVVAAKHFFVRQFGLAGKVVILDEIHTYDLYTGTLLDELIRRLLKLQCTVIVLSATLTEARRRDLLSIDSPCTADLSSDYPLLTASVPPDPPAQFRFQAQPARRIGVTIERAETVSLAERMIDRASEGQCVLWVRNTVREAQEAFRAIRSARREGGPPVALLHSRFPLFRREQLETEWIDRLGKDGAKRPQGCVLVATQVVEQSVDIDADHLVTDLAPTDMLLQRMGRLQRHERKRRGGTGPEILVVVPGAIANLDLETVDPARLREALGPSGRVYAPYVLLRSLDQWRGRKSVDLPADIRLLLEATYRDRPEDPPGWSELRRNLERERTRLCQLALSNTNVCNLPALPDEEGVQTRWNSCPTVSLLLAKSIKPAGRGRTRISLLNGESGEADDREWCLPAARAIHWNLVRIPRHALGSVFPAAPAWLRLHVHGTSALGLVRDSGDIHWPCDDAPSGLTWDPDEGVTLPMRAPGPGPLHHTEDDHESYD